MAICIFGFINRSDRNICKPNEMWHLHSGIWTPITATIFFMLLSYLVHYPESTAFGAEGISLAILVAGSISATGAPIGTLINRDMIGGEEEIQSEVQRLIGFWLTAIAFFIQLISPLGNQNFIEEMLPLPVSFHIPIFLAFSGIFVMLIVLEWFCLEKWDDNME
jgi:peptidoglycan biosynthesis protein MviN/MurJ (putative lipid II flippase)